MVGEIMQLIIDEKTYDIEIIKKRTTRNTYIRVSDDLKVVVTTNIFTSDKAIKKVIEDNINSIKKMILNKERKASYESKFHYLGKTYDVIYTNGNTITIGESKVFIGKEVDMEKVLKKLALPLFQERLDFWYQNFSRRIPYPSLTIRKMKSRWGVCNVRDKRVTLNLELIKKDISCLDYVIVHELSHLIHANHSDKFWELVEENYKDYKKIRKKMKEY